MTSNVFEVLPNLRIPVLLPALTELPILTLVVPLSDTTSTFVFDGFLIVTSELGIADPTPTLPVFKDVSAVPPVPTFNSVDAVSDTRIYITRKITCNISCDITCYIPS